MFKAVGAAARRALLVCAHALPDLIRDCVGLVGVALISYGTWLIFEPAGFIVAGVLMLVGTLASSLGRGG